MHNKTHREILQTFFMESLSAPETQSRATDPRTDVLVAIVLDLLMEVEALRKALLASDAGVGGAAYYQAYRDTAYLTHNSSGPSGGLEKLLELFYPQAAEDDAPWREPRTWRECLFLRRLGFSDDEIRAYKEEAEKAETFT